MQVICHQLIIAYQTATSLENVAGDFVFSSGIYPTQKMLWLSLPPASTSESVIGCFC